MEIGDRVKLRNGVFVGSIPKDKQDHQTAVIKTFLKGDRVYMDRELRGSHYWAKTEIELAP